MPHHDTYRSKVCVICIRKATRDRKITETDVALIRKYAREDYNSEDPDFPCGLCNGCYINLHRKSKDSTVIIKVETFIPDRTLQLRSSVCECTICKVGKSGLNASRALKKKSGRPTNEVKTEENNPSGSITLCKVCFTEIYQGCRHKCSRQRHQKAKFENLKKLTDADNPKSVLKLEKRSRIEEENYSVKESKKPFLSSENLCTIRKNMNLSARKTKDLVHYIRKATGSRSAVESFTEEKVKKDGHKLDNYFDSKYILFIEENKKTKTIKRFMEHTVICTDLNNLVKEVLERRSISDTDALIRVGLDGGGGFLKICLSIFDVNAPVSNTSAVSKKFLDSGVKKVFIIGICPNVPENYTNMKKLWLESGLDNLKYNYTIASDLKLCNILLGIQSHSSMHPCCWCDIDKNNLDKKGKQRSFNSLIDLFFAFFDSKKGIEHAKEFGNVIHPPIIDVADRNTPVIHKVPPPELHLLLGPTNHLLNELSKLWSGCDAWLQSIHVSRSEYHGGCFEGNECRKILKKVDNLEEHCPPELHCFSKTIRSFDEVVRSCFGAELDKNYKEKIIMFTQDYIKLGISITPKVHAVMHHITLFQKRLYEKW